MPAYCLSVDTPAWRRRGRGWQEVNTPEWWGKYLKADRMASDGDNQYLDPEGSDIWACLAIYIHRSCDCGVRFNVDVT